MKECVKDAYIYYHNPLKEECEKEFRTLPILFGRKKKEDAIREKYRQKGLNVVRYEDIQSASDVLKVRDCGPLKPCATAMGYGRPYICGIDGTAIENCECCRPFKDCHKLMDFLWKDLLD